MKMMPILKHCAWLACGTALANLAFSIAAVLSATGMVPGKIAPVALVLIFAALIGVLLCRRAPRGHTYLMGLTIAAYMPALLGLLWVAAFVQDVFRGEGLPGASLAVMATYPPNTAMMLVMVIIAGVVVATGRLVARAYAPATSLRK